MSATKLKPDAQLMLEALRAARGDIWTICDRLANTPADVTACEKAIGAIDVAIARARGEGAAA